MIVQTPSSASISGMLLARRSACDSLRSSDFDLLDDLYEKPLLPGEVFLLLAILNREEDSLHSEGGCDAIMGFLGALDLPAWVDKGERLWATPEHRGAELLPRLARLAASQVGLSATRSRALILARGVLFYGARVAMDSLRQQLNDVLPIGDQRSLRALINRMTLAPYTIEDCHAITKSAVESARTCHKASEDRGCQAEAFAAWTGMAELEKSFASLRESVAFESAFNTRSGRHLHVFRAGIHAGVAMAWFARGLPRRAHLSWSVGPLLDQALNCTLPLRQF